MPAASRRGKNSVLAGILAAVACAGGCRAGDLFGPTAELPVCTVLVGSASPGPGGSIIIVWTPVTYRGAACAGLPQTFP